MQTQKALVLLRPIVPVRRIRILNSTAVSDDESIWSRAIVWCDSRRQRRAS